MENRICTWLLLCTGLLLVAANLPAQSYVTNGGFESGTAGWLPQGTANLSTISPGYSGNNALRATGRVATSSGVRQPLGAPPQGRVYRVTAWVRTGSAAGSNIEARLEQTTGSSFTTSIMGSVSASNRWVRLTAIFTLQPTAPLISSALVFSGPPGGVDVYLDDVSFAPLDFDAPENLLLNRTFEAGPAHWAPHGPVKLSIGAPHTGTNALVVSERTNTWHGVEQSLLGKMNSGEPYFVSGWVKTSSAIPETVKLSFRVGDGSGTRWFNTATAYVSNKNWTWLQGYFTPAFTGPVTDLVFYVEGPAAGVDLIVDDLYVGRTTGLRRAGAHYPGLLLGGVVGNSSLQALNPNYEGVLAANFHLASTENALKFSSTHPAAERYTFANANLIMDFGQAHGGSTRGHTYVWHSSVPSWVTNGMPSAATLQGILYGHIATVGQYVADRVPWWDVVNEAVSDSGGALRSTLWYDKPGIGFAAEGPRYISEAMLRARAADPDCELFYNDYSIETVNTKSTAVYNILSNMVNVGVPVGGLGIQAHLSRSDLTGFNFSSFRSNLQRFSDLGLNIHITEFDLRLPVDTNSNLASASDLWSQGNFYFNFVGTCLAYPRVKVFQTWGVTDAASWIPSFYPGYGAALIFDRDYNRKPAYWGVYNALAGQAEKLPVHGVSGGDTHTVFHDVALSAGAARRLNAGSAGDFITLALEVPLPGRWAIEVGARRSPSSGRFQLAVAPAAGGTYADFGTVQDTYSTASAPMNFDLGTNDFSSAGTYLFRFTVPGRNASSSGHELTLDYIRITPVGCKPVIEPLRDVSAQLGEQLPPVSFYAGDDVALGTLALSVVSSNPALLPATNVSIVRLPPLYQLVMNVVPGHWGMADISVIADDGNSAVTNTFSVTVANPDALSITRTEVGGGALTLTVANTKTGVVYHVERSADLAAWTKVASTNVSSTSFEWTEPAMSSGRRFYRVLSGQ